MSHKEMHEEARQVYGRFTLERLIDVLRVWLCEGVNPLAIVTMEEPEDGAVRSIVRVRASSDAFHVPSAVLNEANRIAELASDREGPALR